jgi:hypothetical protein
MNRMGDFFSIMMMTKVKHGDDAEAKAIVKGLKTALVESLTTGPEDDLCEPAARTVHLSPAPLSCRPPGSASGAPSAALSCRRSRGLLSLRAPGP